MNTTTRIVNYVYRLQYVPIVGLAVAPVLDLCETVSDRRYVRWLDSPAGCCVCGTGGPDYRGRLAPEDRVVRYAYSGVIDASDADGAQPDWTACSRHPLASATPVLDYGEDRPATNRQVNVDTLAERARGPE